MGRGNGNLLFNLALILIFLSPLQTACVLPQHLGDWGEGLSRHFKDWRTLHTGQGLGGSHIVGESQLGVGGEAAC